MAVFGGIDPLRDHSDVELLLALGESRTRLRSPPGLGAPAPSRIPRPPADYRRAHHGCRARPGERSITSSVSFGTARALDFRSCCCHREILRRAVAASPETASAGPRRAAAGHRTQRGQNAFSLSARRRRPSKDEDAQRGMPSGVVKIARVDSQFVRRGGHEVPVKAKQRLRGLVARIAPARPPSTGRHRLSLEGEARRRGRSCRRRRAGAQNNSGCAFPRWPSTTLPSAVTSSNEITLSQLSPCLRHQPADASPSVSPAISVFDTTPDRHRQPVQVRLAVEIAERRAALHPHRARLRIDQHAAHRREVDH